MIPVEVRSVSICAPNQGYVVILHEKDGDRWLPIFIGAAEAQAISLLLQGTRYTRPLTFDLFYNLLDAADAHVQKVAVTELNNNTFYAIVDMKTYSGDVKIDARPSDAIALALRSNVPIFVAKDVMDSASVVEEPSESQDTPYDEIASLNRQLSEAIETESYEEAARLRDRIRELEKKVNLR